VVGLRKLHILLFSFIFSYTALAQRRLEIVNPMTVVSPSGRAKLWVNPSDPRGNGPSFCRASMGGKVLWQKKLPFTFSKCGISDAGIVGGYGYGSEGPSDGDLLVLVVSKNGQVSKVDHFKRKFVYFDHPAIPRPGGLIFDPGNDRMIIRLLETSKGEVWPEYKLSTHKKVKTITPGAESMEAPSISQAVSVSGTPLILINWYLFDNGQMGQRFTVVDESAKPIWRLEAPGDFDSKADEWHRFEVREAVLKEGTITRSNQQRRFEVHLVKKKLLVTYGVTRRGTKWMVKEISRKPYLASHAAKPPPLRAHAVTLKIVKKLVLPKVAAKVSHVHDVGEFHFWDSDKLVFVRNGASHDICVVDISGKLIRNIDLPNGAWSPPSKDDWSGGSDLFLAKVSGSHFILVSSGTDVKVSRAWNLDVSTGTWQTMPKFSAYWVQAIAAFPDGRLVVLSTESTPYTQVDHLAVRSTDGRLIWDDSQDGYRGTADELLSPEDIDVNANGQIVVLDNIAHTIQTFSDSGRFISVVDLDKKWGREPNYPTNVTCLSDGGYWLYDFNADKPCYRLDTSGAILQNFKPSFVSGKKFDTRQDLRVDIKGNPWITNGNSLFQLNSKGVVINMVGSAPRSSGLGEIVDLKVANDGRVYAMDRVTNSIHTFSADGQSLFVFNPDPKEFDDNPMGQELTVTTSGDSYIMGSNKGQLLHLSPNGKRIGYVEYSKGFGPDKIFNMEPSWRWRGVDLVDETGNAVATMRRWPNQDWMSGPDAMAPNGTLMAYEGNNWQENSDSQERKLAFFDAHGKALIQTTLPADMPEADRCAYDGELCYFVTDRGLVAVDKRGHAKWLYKPTGWSKGWNVFPSKGGLALYDGDRTVYWVDTKTSRD